MDKFKVNIKDDATLAEIIVFLNGLNITAELEFIPDSIARHFDKIEEVDADESVRCEVLPGVDCSGG